ncbi:MAG: folate-binding protein [Brachybacterium sp.]|nr:folate-binding protein [Brachybacterium sp.]
MGEPGPHTSVPDLRGDGAVHLPGPDASVPAHYGAPLREQRRLETRRAVVDLAQLEILEVSGADHRSWLTTVTSQQLLDLAPGDSTTFTVLSPQGRLEHLAHVAVPDADSLLLITDPGHREGLVQYLEMMRFAARVQITPRDDLRALGALVPAPEAAARAGVTLPDPVAVYTEAWPLVAPGGVAYGPDPDDVAGWVISLHRRADVEDVAWPAEALAGMLAAEALRVADHRPRLVTEGDERALPHELDLLRTAVHTTKGCYRGQETVAKVLNLGQPPRRLVMLHLDGSQDVPATAGSTVHLPGADGAAGKMVGTVTTAVVHADLGPIALALVRRAVPIDAALLVQVTVGEEQDGTEDATELPTVLLDAAQEPIVLERDHGERRQTARL